MNKIAENLQALKEQQVDIQRQTIAGVILTDLEFRIMVSLLAEPERMFSRSELAEKVCGNADNSNILNVHVFRLRKRFQDVDRKQVIKTKNGEGFQLSENFWSHVTKIIKIPTNN